MERKWMVQTPYGAAKVARVRCVGDQNFYDLELAKLNFKMTTCSTYPSIEPEIGSEVILQCFNPGPEKAQHGRVIEVRPETRQVAVRLVNWQLAQQGNQTSFVTCYVSYSDVQVVAPKELKHMSLYERLLYVHECKTIGCQLFAKEQWEAALEFYDNAILASRSLLYDHTACERAVRANVLLTMIKVSTLASTCKNQDFNRVVNYGMDALRLLHAMEVKGKPKSSSEMPDLADTEQMRLYSLKLEGELKVFGSWRVKAMAVLAQAMMKQKQWESAKKVIQQGLTIILKYTKAGKENDTHQRKEYKMRIAQLKRAKRLFLKLYALVEENIGSEGKNHVSSSKLRSLMDKCNDIFNDRLHDDWPPLVTLAHVPDNQETVKKPVGSGATVATAESSVDDALFRSKSFETTAKSVGSNATAATETESSMGDHRFAGFAGVAELARMFSSANSSPLRVSSLSYPGSRLESDLAMDSPTRNGSTKVPARVMVPINEETSPGESSPRTESNANPIGLSYKGMQVDGLSIDPFEAARLMEVPSMEKVSDSSDDEGSVGDHQVELLVT